MHASKKKKMIKKIFIVDDDFFFSTMVRSMLEDRGYSDIHVFESGEEFLDHMLEAPDLIIMDYKLGSSSSNGIDMLREIKGTNPNIPVLFVSSQEKLQVAVTALKYGAFDYLEKDDLSQDKILQVFNRIEKLEEKTKEKKESRHTSLMELLTGAKFF
jgi:DNA-binding NtrC family response regulator